MSALHDNNRGQEPHLEGTILVAEDSRSVAMLIQSVLGSAGYGVIMAADGVEALKLALTHRPDLIITDAQMPNLDGLSLLRAVQANQLTANIPVILLTGKTSDDEKEKALEAGFIDFITKPAPPALVLARVRLALKSGIKDR